MVEQKQEQEGTCSRNRFLQAFLRLQGLLDARTRLKAMSDPEVLARVFGIQNLREDQQAVVDALRKGVDCFVAMRTGGGKSVCFLLPCLTTSGGTVVVSPLKAISRDQVAKLVERGVEAAVYNG
jgi:superfamily II DNA helicase RecQ